MPPTQLAGATAGRHDGPALTLLDLPSEMLLEIATKLEGDNQSLAALTRTCKYLKPITEDMLYRCINIPRGAEHCGAYLVRTLLQYPERARQISKLSLVMVVCNNDRKKFVVDLPQYPGWVANMMKYFEGLDRVDTVHWVSGILKGYAESIALMLMTMITHTVEVELIVYNNSQVASHLMVNNGGGLRPWFDLFRQSLHPLFKSSLENVKRLIILGGTVQLIDLFGSLEVLELNLISEYQNGQRLFYENCLDLTQPTDLAPSRYRHLHTLILYSDWRELLSSTLYRSSNLPYLLRAVYFPCLMQLDFYLTRSPAAKSARFASFDNLIAAFDGIAGTLDGLTLDYSEGPVFNPKACLSECSRATSFSAFTKLRTLSVLQEVMISVNGRAQNMEWEPELLTFLPPVLETLVIICPTQAVVLWLSELSIRGGHPSLREIVLLCRLGHGVAPAVLEHEQAPKCFKDLLDMGITVTIKEEVHGAFEAEIRKHGSVWEADWGDEDWYGDLYGDN